MTSLTKKFEEVQRYIDRFSLSEKEINKAMRRALNKTVKAYGTLASRDIAKDTGVRVKLIKARMKEIKAVKDTTAKLSMLTYSVPAIIMGGSVQNSDGVSIGGKSYRKGFEAFARRKKGRARRFIFQRVGRDRLPLREARVPIWDETDRAFAQQAAEIEDRLVKNFLSQVKAFGGMFG